MRIRLGSILALTLAGLVATALGLWVVHIAHQREQFDDVLAEGMSSAIVQFGGTLLALATTLLVLHLERRHREHDVAAEIADAHRRVRDEVTEVMRNTAQLLEDPLRCEITLLPDDVWRNARRLLTNAHRPADDPLDYALTDFYTRVNVLQSADRLRLGQLLAGHRSDVAAGLVRRDALAIGPLGEHLMSMLAEADRSVKAAARIAS